MNFKRKVFSLLLILLALSYPIYKAVDVVLSGELGDHCKVSTHRPSGTGNGVFCRVGINIGETLFGADRAHLGYALLLGVTVITFACFALWLISGSSSRDEQ